MAGEIWRGLTQVAVESVYGTYTAATKRMYYTDPKFTIVRQPRVHKFATGSRDNARAFTQGPIEVAGTLVQPLSADEIIELLLMGVESAVTPTSNVWTFEPQTATPPSSAAFEWQDGANPWHVTGCYVDKLQIKGAVNGPTDVTATIFGKNIVAGSITGALAERTPTIIEGWETKLFIDDFGATPGTTAIAGTLINWDVTISNNMARKYFATNVNTLGAVPIGELGVTAVLTFEAASATSLTEYGDFNVPTYRLLQLSFGNNAGSPARYVNINLPGAWSAVALDGTDALTRTYQFTLDYLFDVTNTYGVQFVVQNSRATAWV